MSEPSITGPQVAALRLLAAAGSGPHRRVQRLDVWRQVSLVVARACERGEFVVRTEHVVRGRLLQDVLLSAHGLLVVDTCRALRRRRHAARRVMRFGGVR